MATNRVNVQKVLEMCRDRDGLLNATGRLIDHSMINERVFRKHGMDECADDAKAYYESLAFDYKASADSLRMAGRVPVTLYGRAPRCRKSKAAQ